MRAHVCVGTEAALEEDDEVPFTDKKKSKIKLPFSTKKIMKNVGLKDKDKTSKEKSSNKEPPAAARPVSREPIPRVQHTPSAEVQAKMQDSEEWKAFQAMQDRISQVVSQTSEKVSQMEQGFETDLLSKLTATQTTSPWSVMGVDGVAASPPKVKSPGDQDDQKNVSWVGFEDTFEAETADDTAAPPGDDQQPDVQEVNSNQQVHTGEQVSQLDDSLSSVPPDVVTQAPPPPDVITRPTEKHAPADHVAMATNDATETDKKTILAKQEEPEPETTISSESQIETDTVETADAVDPFDVSNVVSAMTSGKPIFEVLSREDTPDAAAKQQMARKTAQERRERDRQIAAAMMGADDNEATGAKSRPRPRPQAAVKSANPFKITMAASSIEPASLDDDAEAVYDADEFNQTTTTTFSAANPFARADFDESETAAVDSGIWDPFSGADATTFTATFEFDDHADDATNHDLATRIRDKDAESQSSRSSLEEPEETLEPLDPFYPAWDGKGGWNMFLRTPLKKKLTQNRAWKPVFVRLCEEKDAARIRVYTSETESTCLHEMTLGPTFALREMQLQQFDQYTKCHTVKLEHVFYVEKLALKSDRIAPTLRDVTKVRDLKGLKDLVHKPKTTMLLSHSPQATESLKFGTLDLVAYKQFIRAIEDIQFVQKVPQRGRMATSYTKDEIIADLIDEYYADIDYTGHISYHKARVRLFCLTFLTGNPMIEIGINDKKRRGNEIVGRADIIPIKTEDWIKYEDVQLHDIIDKEEYEKSRLIKFRPPDGSRFEVFIIIIILFVHKIQRKIKCTTEQDRNAQSVLRSAQI